MKTTALLLLGVAGALAQFSMKDMSTTRTVQPEDMDMLEELPSAETCSYMHANEADPHERITFDPECIRKGGKGCISIALPGQDPIFNGCRLCEFDQYSDVQCATGGIVFNQLLPIQWSSGGVQQNKMLMEKGRGGYRSTIKDMLFDDDDDEDEDELNDMEFRTRIKDVLRNRIMDKKNLEEGGYRSAIKDMLFDDDDDEDEDELDDMEFRTRIKDVLRNRIMDKKNLEEGGYRSSRILDVLRNRMADKDIEGKFVAGQFRSAKVQNDELRNRMADKDIEGKFVAGKFHSAGVEDVVTIPEGSYRTTRVQDEGKQIETHGRKLLGGGHGGGGYGGGALIVSSPLLVGGYNSYPSYGYGGYGGYGIGGYGGGYGYRRGGIGFIGGGYRRGFGFGGGGFRRGGFRGGGFRRGGFRRGGFRRGGRGFRG